MTRFKNLRPAAIAATAALAFATLAGCAGQAEEAGDAELAKVSLHVYPGALTTIAAVVADGAGIFERHGIDAELVGFPSGPEATQAMVSGGLDLVNTAPSVQYITNEKFEDSGSDEQIKAVMGAMGPIFYSLVGREGIDWPVGDVDAVLAALEGRTVGVTALAADTQNVLAGLMQIRGHDPSKTTFVAVGIGASAVAAITTGQVDAVVATPPSGERMTDDGAVMLIDFRKGNVDDALEPWVQSAWFATQSWLDENPDTARKLQEAFLETQEFMTDPANIDQMAEIFMAQSEGLDLSAAREAIEGIIPVVTAEVDCAAVDNVSEFYPAYTDTFKKKVSCEEFAWQGGVDFTID